MNGIVLLIYYRSPRTRLKTRGDRPFEAVASKLWNARPTPLRFADSVGAFKMQLKIYLFSHLGNLYTLMFVYCVCIIYCDSYRVLCSCSLLV